MFKIALLGTETYNGSQIKTYKCDNKEWYVVIDPETGERHIFYSKGAAEEYINARVNEIAARKLIEIAQNEEKKVLENIAQRMANLWESLLKQEQANRNEHEILICRLLAALRQSTKGEGMDEDIHPHP